MLNHTFKSLCLIDKRSTSKNLRWH